MGFIRGGLQSSYALWKPSTAKSSGAWKIPVIEMPVAPRPGKVCKWKFRRGSKSGRSVGDMRRPEDSCEYIHDPYILAACWIICPVSSGMCSMSATSPPRRVARRSRGDGTTPPRHHSGYAGRKRKALETVRTDGIRTLSRGGVHRPAQEVSDGDGVRDESSRKESLCPGN